MVCSETSYEYHRYYLWFVSASLQRTIRWITHHYHHKNSFIFWTERDPWLSLPTTCSTTPTAVDVINQVPQYPWPRNRISPGTSLSPAHFFHFALRPTRISTYRYSTLLLEFNRVPNALIASPLVLHCTYRYSILNVPPTRFKYKFGTTTSSSLPAPIRPQDQALP